MQKIIAIVSLLLAVASAAPAPSTEFEFPSHARYVLVDCPRNSQIEYWANPTNTPRQAPTEVGKFRQRVTWEGKANSVFTKTQQLISDIDEKPEGETAGMLAFSDNHGGAQARVMCVKDTKGKSSHFAECTSKYICEY